jgi:hypothetical protein
LAVKLANWPTLRCNSRHTRNGRLDALGATQVVSAQRHATRIFDRLGELGDVIRAGLRRSGGGRKHRTESGESIAEGERGCGEVGDRGETGTMRTRREESHESGPFKSQLHYATSCESLLT